jgi:hypothetical protein
VSAGSLYQRVMGSDFLQLPPAVQQFHSLQGNSLLNGWVEVQAPGTFVARCLARCLGAPLTDEQGPLRFELETDGASERWVRHFPRKTMQSRLENVSGRIVEQLGAARLTFALRATSERLQMQLVSLRFLGVPCPRWLLPAVVAEETATLGRLHFRVQASMRLVGMVASYRGYLNLPPGKPE